MDLNSCYLMDPVKISRLIKIVILHLMLSKWRPREMSCEAVVHISSVGRWMLRYIRQSLAPGFCDGT